jgi:uracil-DNA glycosylase
MRHVLRTLGRVHSEIVRCRACPRLVQWRERVARDKVARFRRCTYWGKPVPGFGDPDARILVVGLAPGAHGANRTGRIFTGDSSGDFLFAALHRAGFASTPKSVERDDGLTLQGVYIIATIRCAPPDNTPAPDEIARCARFFDDEIALLPGVTTVVALGAVAWRSYLAHLLRNGATLPRPRPQFAHGGVALLPADVPRSTARILLGSYHVSRQNTQTGKLTRAMFDAVLARAAREAYAR